MADGSVFPAFLKLEYQRDNSAKNTFLAEMASISTGAQERFKQSFDEIGNVIKRSLAGFRSGEFRIDIDTSTLRQAAADAEFAASRLAFTRDAATRLAGATGDTSQATQVYLQALRAQTIEAERNAGAAREQVTTYSRLQAEIDRTIGKNEQLAASFRATFEEQAKAVNYAHAYQQGINEVFAPGLVRDYQHSAQDSASVFESQSYAPKADTRSGLDRMLAGSASLDKAAVSATTLEQVLGRVSTKGQEVAAALAQAGEQAAQAAEEEASRVAVAKQAEKAAMEEAAASAKRYATQANELRQRIDPSLAIQQRFDAELARADELMAAGAISAQEYGQAQTLAARNLQQAWQSLTAAENENVAAKKRGTSETSNVINGIRAQRVAFVQLGQQMQDVVVQTQMGTSATTIFVQQVPQMAFALSGLEGNVNKTYDRIGKFATFLAGGWGAAIFAGIAVLGPFVSKLFEVGDAEEDAKGKSYDFSEGLDVLTLSANGAANAMSQLAQEMRTAIAVQGDFLRTKANVAQQSVSELQSQIKSNEAEISSLEERFGSINPFDRLSVTEAMRLGSLKDNIGKLREALQDAQKAATSADIAVAQQTALEHVDPRQRASGEYNRAIGALNSRYSQSQSDPISAQTSGSFLTKQEYEAEFERLTRERDATLDKIKESNKKERKKTGKSQEERDAEKAAREAQKLAAYGDKAAESIQRINERFDEQPRLVDQAKQATRQLDDIIADLEKRKPAGFEAMVDEANAAKQTIQDALVRPYQELEQSSQRRIELQQLLLQGREAEANALQDIWRLEDQLGPLTAERRAEVLRIAQAEQKQVEAIQRAQAMQQAYLDTTRDIRSTVEGILSGYGKLSDLKNIGQQLRGKVLTENLFGDVFRDMDKWVKEKTGIGSSVDLMAKETERAAAAAGTFADNIIDVSNRIVSAAATSPSRYGINPSWASATMSVPALLAAPQTASSTANDNVPIVVVGEKQSKTRGTVNDLTPERYFEQLSDKLTKPLMDAMGNVLSPSLSKQLGGAISGALEGFMTTGTGFGAVLGGLKDIKGLPQGISDSLSKMFKGAQTGSSIANLSNLLGIGLDSNGSVVGGAIGGSIGDLVGIPGFDVAGSVVGGILGKIFGKRPRGGGTVTQSSVSVSANDAGITGSLDSFGTTLQSTITKIADALGAQVGEYAVGIGRYKEYYQVSAVANDLALGHSYYRDKSSNAIYDGTDAEEAMRVAILNALQDGAIKGIHEGAIKLLQAGTDLDAQIQKALDFENVFKRLKAYTDPVGAALDTLDAEFSKLKDTFDEAGASAEDYAALEKLYGIERTNAIKQAMESVTGSLQSLFDDLTIGNSALSLRDRKAEALAVYQPLAERVKAGDTTAYDDYADAARQLLEIEQQMSGSQSEYFALLDEVTSLTKAQLDATSAVADASANRDSPFSTSTSTTSTTTAANDNSSVTNAITALASTLLDGLGYKLDAVNQNLGSLIEQVISNGSLSSNYAELLRSGTW